MALAAPAPFADLATRAGIDFHALGTRADYEQPIRLPRLWHPTRGGAPLLKTLSTTTEPVFKWVHARWSSDGGIVVASPNSLGARIAQDKLGLPLVTVHVAPFRLRQWWNSPTQMRADLPELVRPPPSRTGRSKPCRSAFSSPTDTPTGPRSIPTSCASSQPSRSHRLHL